MPRYPVSHWSDLFRQTLERFSEPLLRQVAARLFKPRNQWPVDDLIERTVDTVGNAAVVDRRLEAVDSAGRQILALIGHSRQPRWKVGNLVEMLVTLRHTGDLRAIMELLEAGLLFPHLPQEDTRLRSFEQWLGLSGSEPVVIAHPQVTARALATDLQLPDLSQTIGSVNGESSKPLAPISPVHEADGMEWPLRLAVLWQQVEEGPLRMTQQGEFFKRDLDRLRSDPILTAPPVDSLAELPDPGLLTVELALLEDIVRISEGELRAAAALPGYWDEGLPATLESLFAALFTLAAWNVTEGWRGRQPLSNPYPSAYLLSLLILGRLPEDSWLAPDAIDEWLLPRHPFWKEKIAAEASKPPEKSRKRPTETAPPLRVVSPFLLGFAFPFRLVKARKSEGQWQVRLTDLGRWLLGLVDSPPALPAFAQTLMVQPNLEIVTYRQGLSPGLTAKIARFAAWKNLGAACTLQFQPNTVYRALESGQTFDGILQILEQHGMRAIPLAVVESLKTWANKRDRLGVYPSATLFEFSTAEDLTEALARGLPGTRLSDRLAVVANESAIDFKHFRLTATRDYGLPPEKCVSIGNDGVTLTIDPSKSDLLLETEMQRFAEPLDGSSSGNGRWQYRLTPASLIAGREGGFGVPSLENWFLQRTGQALSPAARMLLGGNQLRPLELRRQLVVHVDSQEIADGLQQWQETRSFIEARLGPTALVIKEEGVEEFRRRLAVLGMSLKGETDPLVGGLNQAQSDGQRLAE